VTPVKDSANAYSVQGKVIKKVLEYNYNVCVYIMYKFFDKFLVRMHGLQINLFTRVVTVRLIHCINRGCCIELHLN